MATVTFDETLSTNEDKLRSLIGDTVEDEGPFPKGRNFDDATLTGHLSMASNSLNRAYILACVALASAWSSHAKSVRGTSMWVDAQQVAKQWRDNAADARKNPVDGAAVAGFRVFNASTD